MNHISVIDILIQLSEIPSPSTNEGMMRQYTISNFGMLADKISTDAHGNFSLMKCGRNKIKKTLMIVAHMDEMEVIVNEIEDALDVVTRSIERINSVELDKPNNYRPIGTIPEE